MLIGVLLSCWLVLPVHMSFLSVSSHFSLSLMMGIRPSAQQQNFQGDKRYDDQATECMHFFKGTGPWWKQWVFCTNNPIFLELGSEEMNGQGQVDCSK